MAGGSNPSSNGSSSSSVQDGQRDQVLTAFDDTPTATPVIRRVATPSRYRRIGSVTREATPALRPRLEPLEPRKLLSAPPLDGEWAGWIVNWESDSGTQTFSADVEAFTSSIASGEASLTIDYFDNGQVQTELAIASVERADDGWFSFDFGNPDEMRLYASGGVDSNSDVLWYREQGQDVGVPATSEFDSFSISIRTGAIDDGASMVGLWEMAGWGVSDSAPDTSVSPFTASLELLQDGTVLVTNQFDDTGPIADDSGTWQFLGNGEFVITLDVGGTVNGFIGDNGDIAIVSDVDGTDGEMFAATLNRAEVSATIPTGFYRINRHLITSDSGPYLIDQSLLLELQDDGSYVVFDLDGYDFGGFSSAQPIQTGDWDISANGWLVTTNQSNQDFLVDGHFDPSMNLLLSVDLATTGDDAIGMSVGVYVGTELSGGLPTVHGAMFPQVATADDGHFVMTWSFANVADNSSEVFAQLFDADGAIIADPWRVNTSTAGDQAEVAVAMTGDGDFLIVWTTFDESPLTGDIVSDIWGQYYDANGFAVGDNFVISEGVLFGDGDLPAVAMDDLGRAVVVWSNVIDDGMGGYDIDIMAQQLAADGSRFGTAININSNTTGVQDDASVSMDASGNFVVVWNDYGLTPSDPVLVYGRRFDANGNPIDQDEFLVNGVQTEGDLADVAMNDDGSFVATWSSPFADDEGFGIFMQRFSSAGTRLGGPTTVNLETFGDQDESAVSINADGRIIVSWTSSFNGEFGGDVVYRAFAANGTALSDEAYVLNPVMPTAPYMWSDVSITDSGNAVVVYTALDEVGMSGVPSYSLVAADGGGGGGGGPYDGWSQLDYRLHDSLDGTMAPAVSTLGDGSFVMAFIQDDFSGDHSTIMVQRLSDMGEVIFAPMLVSSEDLYDQGHVDVAGFETGFVVTWQTESPEGINAIWARMFNADGSAITSDVLIAHASAQEGWVDDPSIATRNNGGFVVTWHEGDTNGDIVLKAMEFNAQGTPLGDAVDVTAAGAINPIWADVAYGENGVIVITWAQADENGAGNYIWARTYTGLTTPNGAAFLVSTLSTEAADPRPQVTMTDLGQFAISWSHWNADGEEFGIFVRQYDLNGNATGDPLLANMTRLGSQRDSAIAMNASGQFAVGWTDYVPSDTHMYAVGDVTFQRFDADGTATGWEEVVDDPGIGFGHSGYASIALTDDGDTLVAWTSIDSNTWTATTEWQVFVWDDSGGGGWQNPFDELEGEAIPDVAVNAVGYTVSTWTQRDQTTDDADVFFQILDVNGDAITDAVRANTTTEGTQGYSRLALNDSGEFVITWAEVSDINSSVDIYARKFSITGGAVSDEIVVSSDLTGMNFLSEVAIADNGTFVVTWTNFDPTANDDDDVDVYARMFDANGAATGAAFMVNAIEDGIQEDSDIAMDADGNFTIVWSELYFNGWDEAQSIVGRQFSASGQALTAGNFIVTGDDNGGDIPEIAMAADGSFVITWASELADTGEDFGIFGQWFSAAAVAVGDAFLINETTEGDQDAPVVAMNATGQFVAGWTHFIDNTPGWGGEGDELFEGGDIYYRLYEPFGQAAGSEVLVPYDQGVLHGNILTSVAIRDNGDVVLAWMNANPVTSTSTIEVEVVEADRPAPPIEIDAGEAKRADEGSAVSFAGIVTNGTGHQFRYQWDFGDGFSADTLNAEHTYADNGEFTATFRVWDEDNTLHEDTVVVTVNNVNPLVTGPTDKVADEGDSLRFRVQASDPGNDTLTYRWDMGDGTIYENLIEVAHTYANDGDYTVTVTVTDEDGGRTVNTAIASIANVAPIVDLGMDQVVKVGQVINFNPFVTDPGKLDTLTYEWDFGDNSPGSNEATPTHAFANEGLYTVTLTVRDGDEGVTVSTIDFNVVSEQVTIPATPAAPVLLKDFDLGMLDNDGVTSLNGSVGKAIQIEVTNVASGATVELFAGSTLLATAQATSSKITFTIETGDGLQDGYHAITARQVLDGVTGATSEASIIWIDTDAPEKPDTPVLVEDINRDNITPARDLTFTGAAETYSMVELYRNGELVDTTDVGLSGLWSIVDKNAPLGNHAYAVVVVDLAGNRSTPSDAIIITHLDAVPLTPGTPILQDGDGGDDDNGLINISRPTVTGEADPGTLIRLYIDDVLVGQAITDTERGYIITSSAAITDGTHTLHVTAAYTGEGDDVESKPSSKIKFVVDTTVATLATPYLNSKSDTGEFSDDGFTNDGRPIIMGENAEKGATIIVRDQTGNVIGQTVANGSGRWTVQPDTELQDGTYLISATQIDAAGNESDASDWFDLTIDRTAPTAAPAPDLDRTTDTGLDDADNVTASETLLFSGFAEANALVQLLASGKAIRGAEAQADSQGYWEIEVAKAPKGESTWTVQQTDLAGNVSTQGAGLVVNVVTAAPSSPGNLALSAATDSGESSSDGVTNITRVTVTGTGDAGNTVTLLATDGATELGTTTVGQDGTWQITTSPLTTGEHQLTATQTDLVGNVSKTSKALKVQVDTEAEAPTNFAIRPGKNDDTGRSDADGITSNTRPQFQGDGAERGATINMYDQFNTLVGTTVAKSNGAWAILPSAELQDGTWEFTVRQVDIAGNVSDDSGTFEVTIDRTAPDQAAAPDLAAASDTGVADDDNVTGATSLVFTGTVEAFAEVRLTRDGRAWGKEPVIADANGNFTITIDKAPKGVTNWGIEQTDAAGNVTTQSATLRVEVITKAPKAPSGVTLDSASDTGASDRDGVTSEDEIVVRGTADAGNTVTLFGPDQTTVVGTAVADENGVWTITTTPLADGQQELYVTQTDLVGNTASPKRALRVTIDTEASTPANLAFKTTKYDTGRFSDDGITAFNMPLIVGDGAERGGTVTLYDQSDNVIAIATAKSNGSWMALPLGPFAEGMWELTAVHTDIAGNESVASDPFVITIDQTAPTAVAPDLDAASDDGESNTDNITTLRNLTFQGTVEAGAEVILYRDGKKVADSIFADQSGAWLYTVLDVALGDALWTIQLIDLAGNTSTMSESLLVSVIAA